MYLLDTNHCSFIMEEVPEVLQRLNKVGKSNVAICSIVRGELNFMVQLSKRKKENLEALNKFLKGVSTFSADGETSRIYGDLKARIYAHFGPKELEKRKRVKINKLGFSDNDLWIVAHALRNNLTLVSEDSDFGRMFEVPEIQSAIKCECWKTKASTIVP